MTASGTAFDRLVAALQPRGELRLRGDHAEARCPAHEDRNPSLSVDRGDGRVLVRCHAGCSTEQVVAVLGMAMADLYDEPGQAGGDDWTPRGPAVATYEYRDEDGRLLFGVCRTADKQFPQWRPDPLKPHGRTWSLKGTRRVLYRLPEVIAAVERGEIIFICEGEKDVHAVERAGGVATTNPGGAGKGKWLQEYAEPLRGAEVVIVADRDEPGIEHANRVAASVEDIAASWRIVQAAKGKDAADHLAAGHGLDAFVPLGDEAGGGAAELVADVEKFLGAISASGAELLADVEAFIGRFVVFPSDAAKIAVTLWAAHTHAVTAFESTPRLALLSPEPGSGKTRTLEVLELLTAEPRHALNASVPATFRTIAQCQPTLLFDEVDAIFNHRGNDENADLRGLLNAGHHRGASIPRCVGPTHAVVDFPVFAACALAGLGDLPDTLMSRSVIIRMRRRTPDEQVTAFRHRVHAPEGHALRDRLAAWTRGVADKLADAWPEMPAGVEDRPADVWEPLLAVADAAGGDWPERARKACVQLVKVAASREASLGVRLLGDLRDVFGERQALATEVILDALRKLDEAPWADLRGKPLDARGLARRLKQYGVRPAQQWIAEAKANVRGYARADLADPWARYLPPLAQDDARAARAARGQVTDPEVLAGNDPLADLSARGSVPAREKPAPDQRSSGSSGSSASGELDTGPQLPGFGPEPVDLEQWSYDPTGGPCVDCGRPTTGRDSAGVLRHKLRCPL